MAQGSYRGSKRPVVVAVRLTMQEAQDLDRRRASLTRSEYLRVLVNRDAVSSPKA